MIAASEHAGEHPFAAPNIYSNWTRISVGQFQLVLKLDGIDQHGLW